MEKEEIKFENDVNVNEIKVIIADDDVRTCEEIKEKIKGHEQIIILGIANTDEDEIKMIEELKPDVVITDLMRGRVFSGLDIIKNYAEKENSPKFVIVSFTPEPALMYKYKNIAACVSKTPEINGSELSYKIICAKRTIWKERQDYIENKIQEEKKKSSFLGRIVGFLTKK